MNNIMKNDVQKENALCFQLLLIKILFGHSIDVIH